MQTYWKLISAALLITTAIFMAMPSQANEDATKKKSANTVPDEIRKKLEPLGTLIGDWRGIAMPKSRSTKGVWRQTGHWVWQFGDKPGMKYTVDEGKLMKSGLLTYDLKEKKYRFEMKVDEKTSRTLYGNINGKKLILQTPKVNGEPTYKLTISILNSKRVLVLHQIAPRGLGAFNQLGEVGYTREGTRLAVKGISGPICVVTDGAGTSKVTYKGETYYVCCSGCKAAFDDNPEKIIAEAKARWAKAKEKNKTE